MRMLASILAVCAVTLLVSYARPQKPATPERKEHAGDSATKIKELQKERIAVLKEAAEQLATLYKQARVSFDEVLESKQALFNAELEIAETNERRVELYKNLVAVLKEYEEWAEARRTAGRGLMASVLKAKARRLEAEIHLEQAKMKLANPAK